MELEILIGIDMLKTIGYKRFTFLIWNKKWDKHKLVPRVSRDSNPHINCLINIFKTVIIQFRYSLK